MTREEKNQLIDELTATLSTGEVVYLADISDLNAENTTKLRRLCFSRNVSLRVVKNKLIQKAMERVEGKDFSEMYVSLKGNTALMISENANIPAKLIKEFRKKEAKPSMKAAYVQEAIYLGDNQLETLINLKSKEELLGEIIGLLQSPAKNVISALKSGGNTIAGLVKTLSEREEN